MVMRSKPIGASCGVQLDVPTQNMGKRTRLQKVDNPQGAFVIRRGVCNQQPARHQKISRKKNPGSVVVKRQVCRVVSRRRNYVDSSATQIQMGNFVGPIRETVKRFNSLQVYGYNQDRLKRRELRIAGAMIHMPVGMRHQKRKLLVVLLRQQFQDRFRQGHLFRVRDGAGVDQKSFIGANEKIEKICFKVCAWTLAQDQRLRLVSMNLKGRLWSFLAI